MILKLTELPNYSQFINTQVLPVANVQSQIDPSDVPVIDDIQLAPLDDTNGSDDPPAIVIYSPK